MPAVVEAFLAKFGQYADCRFHLLKWLASESLLLSKEARHSSTEVCISGLLFQILSAVALLVTEPLEPVICGEST
jgi:hypothetical protein